MKTKEQSLSEIVSAVTGTNYGRDTEEAHIQRIANSLSNVTKNSGKSIIEMLSSGSIEYATNEEIDALFDEGGGGGSSSSSGSSGSSPSPSGGMTPEKFSALVQNALDGGAVITLLPGDEISTGSVDYGNFDHSSKWNSAEVLDDSYFGYALYYSSHLIGLVISNVATDGPILYAAGLDGNWTGDEPDLLNFEMGDFRLLSDSTFDIIPALAAAGLGNYSRIVISGVSDDTFFFDET